MSTTPAHSTQPIVTKVYKGCSKITDYDILGKLGEGTFGEVHRARSKRSGQVVALKKILMHNEKDGFPITALREIKLLKLLSHPNILRLEEMSIEHANKKDDKRKRMIMYMVTPYMDHDLSGLLDNPDVHFNESQIKCYMLQLLEGTHYLHDNHILHRDMKAANLLINNKGILQIADFGLARHYSGPTPIPGRGAAPAVREYTTLVVTRWYRPPELLLNLARYTPAIDVWGVGCVFAEMLVGKPILQGDSDQRQLEMVFELMGSPTDDNMPGWRELPGAQNIKPRSTPLPSTLPTRFRAHGSGVISLLNELLRLDWKKRINAGDAMKHPYFRDSPLPAKPGEIPMFEDSHELDRRRVRGNGQKGGPPPPPKGGTVGMGQDVAYNGNGSVNYYQRDNYGARNLPNGGRNPPAPYLDRRWDDRNGGQQPYQGGDRRPAWANNRGHPPDTRLPPRPPPVEEPYRGHGRYADDNRSANAYRDRGRDRDDREVSDRARGGGGSTGGTSRADMDTYIPSYRAGDELRSHERPPREDRPPRDERLPREDNRRQYFDGPPRDRIYDRGPPREKLDYDDRGGRNGHTRSRSRSPMVNGGGRSDLRDRDPVDRDRYARR